MKYSYFAVLLKKKKSSSNPARNFHRRMSKQTNRGGVVMITDNRGGAIPVYSVCARYVLKWWAALTSIGHWAQRVAQIQATLNTPHGYWANPSPYQLKVLPHSIHEVTPKGRWTRCLNYMALQNCSIGIPIQSTYTPIGTYYGFFSGLTQNF